MPFSSSSSIRPDPLDPSSYRDLVRLAIAEDVGTGDVTTTATVPASATAKATLVTRQACVVAGLDVARGVFAQIDPSVSFVAACRDGDPCAAGASLAHLSGPARAILTGERTALNFLQHLSGIATRTRAFVDAAAGRVVILDTRKTIPMFRTLAKYAVRCGGGINHRRGLFDGVLVKDNHIRMAGGVVEAVRRARAAAPGLVVEVETQSLDEVRAAIDARADVIMLDNLDDEAMGQAVALIAGRAKVEVSGGVTLDRIGVLAGLGVDFVSVGALTHSAPAVDISLDVEVRRGE